MKIRHRYSGEILFKANASSMSKCIEKAVRLGVSLNGASLIRADLSGANLRGANLRGANLHHANLHHANLRGANLRGANLHHANLRNADFFSTNIYDANLNCADISGVDLRDIHLSKVTLISTKGILRFNGEKHEAIAYVYKGVVYIKIGCEHYKAQEWIRSFKRIGKNNQYSKQEIESYGMFIKLATKQLKGRK